MKRKSTKIPRVEVGRWVQYEESIWPDPSVKVPQIVNNEIHLWHKGQIVKSRSIETAPRESRSYPMISHQEIVWSPNSEWLWHLGYKNSAADISLLFRDSLEEVASISPVIYDLGSYRFERLATWDELDAVSCFDPDILVAWGEGAGRLYYLLILKATNAGIVEMSNVQLAEAVNAPLDGGAYAIKLVSDKHLLVVDDVGGLRLYEWPTGKLVHEYWITDGLEEAADESVRIWPDDNARYEFINATRNVAWVQNVLLVEIGEYGSTHGMGIVAFEPQDLKPLGLIRLPIQHECFRQIQGYKFGFIEESKLRTWTLELDRNALKTQQNSNNC